MDADLKSIAAARRMAESAFEAYKKFLGTDPAHVDAIVDAMARAIEPEAARLGQMAVDETGYGNAEGQAGEEPIQRGISCRLFARHNHAGNVVAR